MATTHFTKRLMHGALSGFVGTMTILGARTISEHWLPETMPPVRQEPGAFMVEQAEVAVPEEMAGSIPETAKAGAAQTLALGYGLTTGALYAMLHDSGRSVLFDGALLGVTVWAAGYLGWMPALNVTPPIREQRRPEVAGPLIRHVLFGIATVAAYRWLSADEE